MLYDVVYPLKRVGGEFSELRHSLRSLAHFPHRKVHVVGGKPDWFTGNHIPAPVQQANRYRDAVQNIAFAVMSPEVSDKFWLFNDDFFCLAPPQHQHPFHRGTLREFVSGSPQRTPYAVAKERLADFLEGLGFKDPLALNTHTPLLVNRYDAKRALDRMPHTNWFGFRSVYGATAKLSGIRTEDVKISDIHTGVPRGWSWVSSSDEAFRKGQLGRDLRDLFPNASPYEGVDNIGSRNLR